MHQLPFYTSKKNAAALTKHVCNFNFSRACLRIIKHQNRTTVKPHKTYSVLLSFTVIRLNISLPTFNKGLVPKIIFWFKIFTYPLHTVGLWKLGTLGLDSFEAPDLTRRGLGVEGQARNAWRWLENLSLARGWGGLGIEGTLGLTGSWPETLSLTKGAWAWGGLVTSRLRGRFSRASGAVNNTGLVVDVRCCCGWDRCLSCTDRSYTVCICIGIKG